MTATRRRNGATLLLTSFTDSADKIGDHRPPADTVRPEADHYQALFGFIQTHNNDLTPPSFLRLRLFAERTQPLLNSGNYPVGRAGTLSRMSRDNY